jgi:hypothetical protein
MPWTLSAEAAHREKGASAKGLGGYRQSGAQQRPDREWQKSGRQEEPNRVEWQTAVQMVPIVSPG